MPLSEFELIEQFFTRGKTTHSATRLGIGDDCALLKPPDGAELAVTTDTLVEGIHFPRDVDPEDLGYKSLGVNLSDLSAMGAEPMWATLALTLPKADKVWLKKFCKGFFALAEKYSVELVGGDTTRGALTITVQAMGTVPAGGALLRSAARPGDRIYVTGFLGDAGLALQRLSAVDGSADSVALGRLHRPEPRIDAGLKLRGLANSCIDISDGLAADLNHILQSSNVGASLDYLKLPMSQEVGQHVHDKGDYRLPLCAGDDYELCFTIDCDKVAELDRKMATLVTSNNPAMLQRYWTAVSISPTGWPRILIIYCSPVTLEHRWII